MKLRAQQAWKRSGLKTSRFAALIAISLLQAGDLGAAPLGNLRDLVAAPLSSTTPQWELRTEGKPRLRISLLRADMLRIEASTTERFAASEDKAAPIVLAQALAPTAATPHKLSDQGDHFLLQTSSLALRINKKPLRLALYRADNQQLLWRETESLDLSDKLSVQTLSSDKSERFFGGGPQNGRF